MLIRKSFSNILHNGLNSTDFLIIEFANLEYIHLFTKELSARKIHKLY